MEHVERWGMKELRFKGIAEGNPFVERDIEAVFTGDSEVKKVWGFYDGNGEYVVRFMPAYVGTYHYHVSGSFSNEQYEGNFEVIEPSEENHGPVSVKNKVFLAYADGTPYYSIGTTCYAWAMQSEKMQKQTLVALEESDFNKIRFCFFPKYYDFNLYEPCSYPYVRGERKGIRQELLNNRNIHDFHTGYPVEDISDFNCYEFNVAHFKRFDEHINALMEMGIEADMILFHPYDKWGFSMMESECEDLYLRYVTARYGAYRNIWWSMANEYDLFPKTLEEWEHLGKVLMENDVHEHMRSIHNCVGFYDYNKEWITHCSMQRQDIYKHVEYTDEYIKKYNKPVVWDEISYEGNISWGWGNITAEEMVRRFWETVLRGGYPGHGETYVDMNATGVQHLWWSHGEKLKGKSHKRFGFLKKIWGETKGGYLKRVEGCFDEVVSVPADAEPLVIDNRAFYDYELHYYGFGQLAYRDFEFPESMKYRVEVIDTWNMTVTDIGVYSGFVRVKLPNRQYMAVRLQKLSD